MRRAILIVPLFALWGTVLWAAEKDTPKAAATREKLKQKVTVDVKDDTLKNALEDLEEQAKVKFRLDLKGGVSQNKKITYKAKDKPLAEVLDEMFKKDGLGYYVISNEKDVQYDGYLFVKQGPERGYPKGEEPKKDK